MPDDTPITPECPMPYDDTLSKGWGREEWLVNYRNAGFAVVADDGLYVTLGAESGMTAVAFSASALGFRNQQTEIEGAWLITSATGCLGLYKHPGKGLVLTEDTVRKMPVTVTVEEAYRVKDKERYEQHHLRTRLLRDGTRVRLPDGESNVEWRWGSNRAPGDPLADLPTRYEDAFTEPDLPLTPTALDDIAEPLLLPGGFARSSEVTWMVTINPVAVETVLLALAAELDGQVVWLDYGAAGPARFAALVRALDVDATRVVYQYRPPVVTRLALDSSESGLIVVDGMVGLAEAARVDEKHALSLSPLLARLREWAESGPAVVVVDRPRSFRPDGRPYGSSAKTDAAGAVWAVEVGESVGPGRKGEVRLVLVQDWGGDLAGEVSVMVDLSGRTPEVTW